MSLYESVQYLDIYKDDDYMIGVDIAKGWVNLYLREKGLTLHFSYEDFRVFRESIDARTSMDVDEELSKIYMAEKGITLCFAREELHLLVALLHSLETMPRWSLCWSNRAQQKLKNRLHC